MKTFDELTKLSDSEKLEYLREQSEQIIASAPPHSQLKLRHLQSECNKIRRTHKNPYLACLLLINLTLESAERMALELKKL